MSRPSSMRLLLLPISTRRVLIYCEPPGPNSIPAGQQSYLDKGVAYAAKTWTDWEKQDSGWKLKATEYGNKMLRRIPFEEWGLKSIPPLKKVKQAEAQEKTDGKVAEAAGMQMVEVRYPKLYQGLCKESIMQTLQRLATERQGLHKKRLYGSIGVMPLTIPFGLLPIIPNIPFFYLAFRAFSHWRALLGSQHLDHLVKNNLLNPSPSQTLDRLYTAGLLHSTREDSRASEPPTDKQSKQVTDIIQKQLSGASPTKPHSEDVKGASNTTVTTPNIEKGEVDVGKLELGEEVLLLRGWNGKLLAEQMGLPGLEIEIERAVEQVERDLAKGKVLKEEKEGLEKGSGQKPEETKR